MSQDEVKSGGEKSSNNNASDTDADTVSEITSSIESAPVLEDVQFITDSFGLIHPSETEVIQIKRFTWITKNKLVVQLITYGATITCIKAPDRYGNSLDIVLGFENIEDYVSNKHYFGSTIGRVTNVIEDGSFSIKSQIHILSGNETGHHYNGGVIGFDKVNWNWSVDDKKVILSYLSPDGEEGYPGSLLTQISYVVTVDNTIKIQMKSTTTKPTPVNISNQIYFNLAGHDTGPCEIYEHIVTINADKYTPVTEDQITIGEKLPVGGTIYDFRIPRMLGDVLAKIPGNGYDTNFCITKGDEQELSFASRVLHPKSGRVLEIYSDQVGLQFQTANNLPDPSAIREGVSQESISPGIKGKNGAVYQRHGAFYLQSQGFPNAVNLKHFPSVILYPGREYIHNIVFKFGLQLGKYC